ncbi:UxaA family hydrolase [Bacillus thermotolerans]|uniref:Hydrolase, UxaA family n=1 Tax=Bacillus thermotolerans TaxID=1221996 RepID=A0A0F5HRD7_BACTR|nr:UxaA family hydrolase [Bacillus thermotolerans]KKB35570.1 Hydrolase, UxaA family [Bacillus thermotolerans]KKB36094.1 Hydrolase, UxaA family [Bacillus thermotolerans]
MSNARQTDVLTKSGETTKVSTHKFLIHHKGDHVGVATSPIEKGERVVGIYMDDNTEIEVVSRGEIPLGHKISLVNLEEGAPVLKYGVKVGVTTEAWEVGDYVHTHNIKTARW